MAERYSDDAVPPSCGADSNAQNAASILHCARVKTVSARPTYALGTGGQMRTALFGPLGAWVRLGTTEWPLKPSGELATAGA